jgi:hypothetical protein
MTVKLQRADERFHTTLDWLDSHHSFSFGDHYDPANTHFGLLMVNNDDRVRPHKGFAAHQHQNMEIVTWVLAGALEHRDSTGRSGLITPGLAQRMSAGRGISHSEKNGCAALGFEQDVHFVQMWVPPDEVGIDPGYEQAQVPDSAFDGRFAVIASGMAKDRDEAAVRIASSHAALSVARLGLGEAVTLPDAPFAHLFVARGSVELEGAGRLAEGDGARLRADGGRRVTATGPAEILVWEMDTDLADLR